eukprot:364969-Chlamydomonas_euryale.AAC.5
MKNHQQPNNRLSKSISILKIPDATATAKPYTTLRSAVVSYDQKEWLRVPTDFDVKTGELSIRHTPARDTAQYAFFAPFTQHAVILLPPPSLGYRTATLIR